MSTAWWSAVACAVVGVAVGAVLPAIGDKVAHGHVRPTFGRLRSDGFLRGRVLVAGATSAVAMGVFGYLYRFPTLAGWCWLTATGVCLAFVDIECSRLPTALVVTMGLGGLLLFVTIALTQTRFGSLATLAAAAGVTAVIATAIALIAPGHLGGGDVRLYPVLAMYLGWCGWTTVLLGMFAGALFTIAFAVVSGRTRVAAGPSLILGALVAIALGADTGTA